MATSSLPASGYIRFVSDQAVLTLPVGEDTINRLIDFDAAYYNVSAPLMREIIARESQFYQKAIGDHGTSFGLSQIHLPAHPEISIAQAENPIFAINFLAQQLSVGNGYIWSTYNAALASLGP